MPLLIDGYNLMYAAGVVGRGRAASSLERSRNALLNFLVESLDAGELHQATIVFDAASAPPGLPRAIEHRGLAVRFAAGHADADELLEEMIRAHSAPRKLIVVSSDHRVQRAATRRRARAIDSDVWYQQVIDRRRAATARGDVDATKPMPMAGADHVDFWLRQFGLERTPVAPEPHAETSSKQSIVPPAAESPGDGPSSEALTSDIPTREAPPHAPPAIGVTEAPAELLPGEPIFPPEYVEEIVKEWAREEPE